MPRNKFLTHPLFVLACAAPVMLSYVAWIRWQHPGVDHAQNFFYVLPIIVPFVAFVMGRVQEFRPGTLLELVVDVLVVGTAMMRVIGDVPFVSGHALFLSYAITRPSQWLTKLTATLVMLQVIYLKVFVWHDLITPVTGIILGVGAGLAVRRILDHSTARAFMPIPNSE